MGRMFNALKSVDSSGTGPTSRPQVLTMDAAPAVPPMMDDDDFGGDFPFIEVGPHRSIEASADVMAAPLPPSQLPQLAVPSLQTMTPPRPMAFREVPIANTSRVAAEICAFHQPAQPTSGQYRELMSTIQGRIPVSGPAILLFAGVKAGIGTTTLVLNLAVTAARPGRRRVLVVDAELRRPALAVRLGIPDAPGIREVLAGAYPLEKAIYATEQANLSALPAGLSSGAGPLRFQAETVGSLLRRLRQQFDIILVDGPIWDAQPEVTNLGRACDAVFLVTGATEGDSTLLDNLFRAVPEQGAHLAGCVVAGR